MPRLSRFFPRSRDILKKLQDLHAAGVDEGVEADGLREEYDDADSSLSEFEQQLLKGLSADLYSLSNEDIFDPLFAAMKQDDLQRQYEAARTNQDWPAALTFLRADLGLPKDLVAFLRARCWEGLGDLTIALWFMELAETIGPSPNNYSAMVLRLIGLLNRNDDAIAKASAILEAGGLVEAGMLSIHVLSTLLEPNDVRDERLGAFAEVLLGKCQSHPEGINPHWALVLAHDTAWIMARRGKHGVRDAYRQLATRYPSVASLWVAYGLDVLESDPTEGEAALRQAVALGTSLIWPSTRLAFIELERSNFGEAATLADEALTLTNDPMAKAELLELIAAAGRGNSPPLGPRSAQQDWLSATLAA